nr:class I SAM-dependent methyltransferase [Pelagibacterium limicola]
MSERYYRQPIADEESYRIKLEVTQALLRPDMEILEFGCGTGGTAIKHAARVRHIRAIDFSEAMLEKARARAHAAGVDNVTFEREDIVDLAMPDEIYDMVLGMSILHLLEDPDAVIAKVFAMLKPGGHFVSSTACLGDTMGFFKLIAPAGRALGLLPIINVMTADALVEKFRRAGFDIAHRWQPGKSKAMFLIGKKPG